MKSTFLFVLLFICVMSSLRAQDVPCSGEKHESSIAKKDDKASNTQAFTDHAKNADATLARCTPNPALDKHRCAGMATEAPCWANVKKGVYTLQRTEGAPFFYLSASHDDLGRVAISLLDLDKCRSSSGHHALGNIGIYTINGRIMKFFGSCVNRIAYESPVLAADQDTFLQQMKSEKTLAIETPHQGKVVFDVREFPHVLDLLKSER
jgi:hypothetical protein